MPKYIFMLGQASDLAKAELLFCLGPSKHLDIIGPNFIVAETTQTSQELLAKLGGTIKIAKFLDKIDSLEKLDASLWQKYIEGGLSKNEKIFFGFSLYNDSQKNYQAINRKALSLKKQLQSQDYKARLVTSRQAELSSVIIAKNKLLGRELIIIKHDNYWLLGLTEVVQDFADYGHRDIGRPYRDDKSGMLPPKVAKMMINLGAGQSLPKNILDPFCGSGTILQEALLLGFKNVYGSDISSKATKNSLDNLAWLKANYKLPGLATIKNSPVQKLSQAFAKTKFDLIVTEPFMGNALIIQKTTDIKTLQNIQSELKNLYQEAFEEFYKVLSDKGKIIFVFPIFILDNKKIATLDEEAISSLGFVLQKPWPNSGQLSATGNIIYNRVGQKVAREITLWQKKLNLVQPL